MEIDIYFWGFSYKIPVTDWAVNMQKALPFLSPRKTRMELYRFHHLAVNHNIICASEDKAPNQMITCGVEEDLSHKLKIIKYFGKRKGLDTHPEAQQTLTTALSVILQWFTQVWLKR